MISIDRVNDLASKFVLAGWFAGLVYFAWFASEPVAVPFWAFLVVAIAGIFPVSIIVGGGMAMLAGLITKVLTGNLEGSPHAFSWAAFISPVLAFFIAKYVLLFTHSLTM